MGRHVAGGRADCYTDRTITDRGTLQVEIDKVRELGWAQAIGEREDDVNAVAVPVLDGAGTLIAVLGVQGPWGRFTARAMRSAIEPLAERAAALASAF